MKIVYSLLRLYFEMNKTILLQTRAQNGDPNEDHNDDQISDKCGGKRGDENGDKMGFTKAP